MSFLQPTTQFPFHNSIRASIIHRPCSLVYPLFMYTSIPEPLPSFPTSPSIIPSHHEEKKKQILHLPTGRRARRRRILRRTALLIRIDLRSPRRRRHARSIIVHRRPISIVHGRRRRHILHVVPTPATLGTPSIRSRCIVHVDGLGGPGGHAGRESAFLTREQPGC